MMRAMEEKKLENNSNNTEPQHLTFEQSKQRFADLKHLDPDMSQNKKNNDKPEPPASSDNHEKEARCLQRYIEARNNYFFRAAEGDPIPWPKEDMIAKCRKR